MQRKYGTVAMDCDRLFATIQELVYLPSPSGVEQAIEIAHLAAIANCIPLLYAYCQNA